MIMTSQAGVLIISVFLLDKIKPTGIFALFNTFAGKG